MQVSQLPFPDEYHLRQRKIIETLIGLPKEKYHLVSSKHRSISGFLAGVFSSLCAYQLCHEHAKHAKFMNNSFDIYFQTTGRFYRNN